MNHLQLCSQLALTVRDNLMSSLCVCVNFKCFLLKWLDNIASCVLKSICLSVLLLNMGFLYCCWISSSFKMTYCRWITNPGLKYYALLVTYICVWSPQRVVCSPYYVSVKLSSFTTCLIYVSLQWWCNFLFKYFADSWCCFTHANNAFAFPSACSATQEGTLNALLAKRNLQASVKRLHFLYNEKCDLNSHIIIITYCKYIVAICWRTFWFITRRFIGVGALA